MVSFFMKTAGCVCMMAGASGVGGSLSADYTKRVRELVQLRQMIYLLKGQIVYANAPLEEALAAVAGRTKGALAEIFARAAERIREAPCESFHEIWREAVETFEMELSFSKEDRQSFISMADHLGYLDRDMQERSLLLYLEELDAQIEHLKEQKKEKCRLFTSLGILGGMFLSVLLW